MEVATTDSDTTEGESTDGDGAKGEVDSVTEVVMKGVIEVEAGVNEVTDIIGTKEGEEEMDAKDGMGEKGGMDGMDVMDGMDDRLGELVGEASKNTSIVIIALPEVIPKEFTTK